MLLQVVGVLSLFRYIGRTRSLVCAFVKGLSHYTVCTVCIGCYHTTGPINVIHLFILSLV